MPTLTRASVEKFKDGCPKCKGRDIEYVGTGRSVWVRPFDGGFGEVKNVGELYCPACDGRPEPPSYGTPIYSDEFVECR